MKKISVIMGIYNCADTLEEAVDSIQKQTYDNWELILCDDGSTDSTYAVAQKLAEQDPRIILLKNECNLGLNKTLNACLAKATGDYIARMDGDDLSVPERFERLAAFLDAHPEYGFVSSWMTLFDEQGDFGTIRTKETIDKFDLARGSVFCHAPVMIRQEAYRAVNGYSEEKYTMRVEDVDLWFRLYAAGYKGYNMQEPLYKMRDGRDAIRRRKFVYRVNSTRTRLAGYRRLHIPLRYYPKAFRPVLIGLLPTPIYKVLHRRRHQ